MTGVSWPVTRVSWPVTKVSWPMTGMSVTEEVAKNSDRSLCLITVFFMDGKPFPTLT